MPNIFVLRQDFDERKTDRIPQDIFFVCLHIYVAEAVVYVLLPNLVRGRLVDGMVSCDLAWVAAGLIPCRISDGCSRITFYRFCMGACPIFFAVYGAAILFLFLSYSLSYSPSIWDCMNIGASGWMLPLCSTSFPLPKMRWRVSASGWWSEGFLQWASMRRFYMEYSIGCCCGKPFSDG